MIDNFKNPKTKEEFLAKAKEVSPKAARAVMAGLDVKLKRVAGPLVEEKQFFADVIEYKENGKLPERFTIEDDKKT